MLKVPPEESMLSRNLLTVNKFARGNGAIILLPLPQTRLAKTGFYTLFWPVLFFMLFILASVYSPQLLSLDSLVLPVAPS